MVEMLHEARHEVEGDALHLAVAAAGHRGDQPGRGVEDHPGLRLPHRQDPGLQQDRGHAHGIGARHGVTAVGLHGNEGGVRPLIGSGAAGG